MFITFEPSAERYCIEPGATLVLRYRDDSNIRENGESLDVNFIMNGEQLELSIWTNGERVSSLDGSALDTCYD